VLHVIARVMIMATAQSHLAKFVLGHRSDIELFVFDRAVLHHSGTALGISLLPDEWMQLWRCFYAVHLVSSKLACPRGAKQDALDDCETWD